VKECDLEGIKLESHSFMLVEVIIILARLDIILSRTMKNKKITPMSEIMDPSEDKIFQEKNVSG